MKITSKETTKEKMAEKLGLDQPSALDLVDRKQFATTDAFLDAATRVELERSSPEYQSVRRRLAAELAERDEAAEREAQNVRYQQLRANVQLDDYERRTIDAQATELAQRDLAAKKSQHRRWGHKLRNTPRS